MNRKISLAFLGLVALATQAREIRTPLSITSRGYNHFPFPWPVDEEMNWGVNFWGVGLHRDADRAFGGHNTVGTTPLSTLYFGAPSFTISSAFAPGTVIPEFPLVSVATITPQFSYSENTAIVGFDAGTVVGSNGQWNIGVRAHVPFRAVNVTLNNPESLAESTAAGDFSAAQVERVTNPVTGVADSVTCYAYRMDFVSALAQQQAGILPFTPFVNYAAVPNLTMNNVDVTNAQTAAANGNGHPIKVAATDTGLPPATFCALPPATPGPFLPPDGTLVAGSDAYFAAATSYLPLGTDVAAQRRLWLTPVVVNDPTTNTLAFTEVSDNVFAALNFLAETTPTPIDFLNTAGISLASQNRYQVGDLDAEFYVNRYWCDWFAEGVLGMRFPTGRDITAAQVPNLLIAQTPTGNNRHFELHAGGMVGWEPVEWFALKADAYFNYAFNRIESVAAPFAGATVNNIGNAVPARVHWYYFVGDLDFTFVPSSICPQLGLDVGYQAYVKSHDHIHLQQTGAIPFAGGATAQLDAAVLEQRTFRLAHKVKSELFYQTCSFQIYGGFTHTFAGQNVPRDSDTYLGMVVYF